MDDTIAGGKYMPICLFELNYSSFFITSISRFAELTATIFINENIPVYLYRNVTATPFVPFCVLEKKALCGIMVTASHNPKEDNGYKVYWENSAQIIPPHDKNIQNSILDNLV